MRVFNLISELPLYLLLGILCGLVSLALSRCTSYMFTIVDNLHKATGIPRSSFPVLGGLSVGLIALIYPEILYWGFENVDILLESRPFVKGLSTDLLLQLIAVKIVATSLCRASGLVGGYYAPSLFIGGATGMAYGKLISLAVAESNPTINLSVLEVASPQAYGLVLFFPFWLYGFYHFVFYDWHGQFFFSEMGDQLYLSKMTIMGLQRAISKRNSLSCVYLIMSF